MKTVDGVGLYSEDSLILKKDLLAAGVRADYLHDPSHRKWIGRKGPVVGDIIIGLSTSGAVAAFQIWVTKAYSTKPVRVRARRHTEPDGTVDEWFEAEGTGPEVARQFEQFRKWTDG